MDDFRQMIGYDELPSDDTVALARAAAEAIRGLNYATRCDAGLGQPRPPTTSSAPCPWPRAGSGSCSPRSPATWTGPCSRPAQPRPRRGPRPAHQRRRCLPRRRPPAPPPPWPATSARPGNSSHTSTGAPPAATPGPGMIDKLQAHYGFTRMPFGRDLAPGMLHRHAAHNEAVARITWCISERSIGVITGEVGAGKTVSVRTVLAGLDASRHTIIYLPNPMIGVRGLHEMIVATFGGQPDRSGSRLTAQASAILAAERDERGKTPVLIIDEAHLLRYEQLETIRMLTNHNLDADSPAGLPARRPAHPAPHHETRRPGRPGTARRPPLRHAPHDQHRDQQLHHPPPQARRPRRRPVQRRRRHRSSTPPPAATPAPSTTSPSRPSSPPTPPAKPSSTRPPPAPPSAKSPTRKHRHLTHDHRRHTQGPAATRLGVTAPHMESPTPL